jgi:hypothetical protein
MATKVLHSGTVTATGASAAAEIPRGTNEITLQSVVAAIGGTTPSYTVRLEGSFDGTNWFDVVTLAAQTANGDLQGHVSENQGTTVVSIPNIVRAAWTVSGTTPTATLTVTILRRA